MKIWKCPNCKRVRYAYEDTIIKVCHCCQIEMKEVDYDKKNSS